MYPIVFIFREENETDTETELFMSPQLLLTFTQRDLNGYSQPSRRTLFSLGI